MNNSQTDAAGASALPWLLDREVLGVPEASRQADADREGRKFDLQVSKDRDDADLKDAVERRGAEVQAGAHPSLAAVKLRKFQGDVQLPIGLREKAGAEQERIIDSEKLTNPDETPNGKQFVHPWTNQRMTMSDGVRHAVWLRARQAQQDSDALRTQSENRLRDLGVKIPKAGGRR